MGTVDLNGLVDAKKAGKPLDGPCYICGQPRFREQPIQRPKNPASSVRVFTSSGQVSQGTWDSGAPPGDDPRVTGLALIDRGRELRRRCEGGGLPPIEAIEMWRGQVKEWMQENHLEAFVAQWDRFPGKSSLDPPEIEGFTGIINSKAKAWWDGMNVRILRLEELLRRL